MLVVAVIVLIVIAVAVVDGYKNGVIRRLLETAGLILIFLFASRLADWIEPHMSQGMGTSPKLAFFGSWAIVILGGVIVVRILAGGMASIMKTSVVGKLDQVGGAAVGLLFGSLITSVLLVGLLALPVGDDLKREVQDNPFTGPLLRLAPGVYDAASGIWSGEDFFQMIEKRLEPLAGEAKDTLKGFMGEADRDG